MIDQLIDQNNGDSLDVYYRYQTLYIYSNLLNPNPAVLSSLTYSKNLKTVICIGSFLKPKYKSYTYEIKTHLTMTSKRAQNLVRTFIKFLESIYLHVNETHLNFFFYFTKYIHVIGLRSF